ncbi:oxidoreductase [Microtetraspora sp. NBRC 13810]|uniref:NAD(P)H-dependent flavin oxidoreductase n=1 Tax=Microtetraspora sp. NBRC 13810 TaxID=3030990 RepID=UPI0024A3A867|nr:nitronate monooxygenase [Microtetraspora sp. NBRC 13810]GLW11088.1 oxidoreductase [Microtetraspora sp. NBRC 13810]
MASVWDRLLDRDIPLIAAPMAGATTPALVSAVTSAGGFGFLPAGMKTPEALRSEMEGLRGAGVEFGVNVFVPNHVPVDEEEFRRYARELADEGRPYGLDLAGAPLVTDDDHWQDKIDQLLETPVPVVSFTFGLPGAAAVAALRRAGSRVLVTVTGEAEAAAARDLGADGFVVQGGAAGGHSATHTPDRPAPAVPLPGLVRRIVLETGLPVIAGGGVAGPGDVRDLVAAGASAVMVGTLLLRTDESGAGRTHRDALVDPAFTETVVTRAFTGRPARSLRNGFVDRHDAGAPHGYPAVHHLTRELRAAAAAAGDADRLHLWAGTGHRHAPTGPASAVVAALTARL